MKNKTRAIINGVVSLIWLVCAIFNLSAYSITKDLISLGLVGLNFLLVALYAYLSYTHYKDYKSEVKNEE